MRRKANATLYIVFILLGIILLLTFVFATSVNSVILANLVKETDKIIDASSGDIDSIGDANVRNAVKNALDTGTAAGIDTYDVNSGLYRYAWVFFIFIMFIVIFLLVNARSDPLQFQKLI